MKNIKQLSNHDCLRNFKEIDEVSNMMVEFTFQMKPFLKEFTKKYVFYSNGSINIMSTDEILEQYPDEVEDAWHVKEFLLNKFGDCTVIKSEAPIEVEKQR